MGASGRYYDRDVSTGPKLPSGITSFAQEEMSRSNLCNDLLPLGRRLVSTARHVAVLSFDMTGSMGILPRIFMDKVPMIAGQIAIQSYLENPQISLSGIGDVTCDVGPLQICDFVRIKELDPWLKKIWVESGGGSLHFESYEFMAYFYARMYEMQNAELPICIFTGDEGFREKLSGADLKRHFGGQHENMDAQTVFEELKAKFRGNVFLLHRYYVHYGLDAEIVQQWEAVLGRGFIVKLPEDPAIADVTLGIIALVSGKRDIKGYVEDMKGRPLEMGGKKYKPQSQERIDKVVSALDPLERALRARNAKAPKEKPAKTAPADASTGKKKKGGLKI